MKNVITAENIRSFAYVNSAVCTLPAKGLVVDFRGLGNMEMISGENPLGERLGQLGILYIVPYLNPWNWMNPQAVRQTDVIVKTVLDMCGASGVPAVYTGGSMGGLACLVYTRYAAITPVACVANCPVCDLPYHYTERPDLPRTLLSAFDCFDAEALDAAMRAASPLHLAQNGEMPRINYSVFHCEEDLAVNKHQHSDRFVDAMKANCEVDYVAVPGRGHCDLGDEMLELFTQRIIGYIIK